MALAALRARTSTTALPMIGMFEEVLRQRDSLLRFAEAVAEYDEYTDDAETEDPAERAEALGRVLSRLEERARAAIADVEAKSAELLDFRALARLGKKP